MKIMLRDITIIVVAMLLSSSALAYDTKPLTLNNAIKIALKNSPIIKSSEFDLRASKASLGAAKGLRFPKIDLRASYTRFNRSTPYIAAQSKRIPGLFSNQVYSWNLSSEIPIYEGGKLSDQVNIAKIQMSAMRLKVRFTRNDLIANVTNSFNKILQLQQLRKARADSVKSFQNQRDNTGMLVKVGRVAKVDLLRSNVLLASEKEKLINAGEAIERARNTLAFFMDVDRGTIDNIKGMLNGSSEINISGIETRINKRPAVLYLMQKVRQAKKRVYLAKDRRYPKLSLVAGYGSRAGSGLENNRELWQAGVVASINIFSGGVISSDIMKQKALYRKAEEVLRVEKLTDKLAAYNAVSLFNQAASKLNVAKTALKQAAESLRIENLKYKTGAGTITDVLMAQSALSDAQANVFQALFDKSAAATNFRLATGTLKGFKGDEQ